MSLPFQGIKLSLCVLALYASMAIQAQGSPPPRTFTNTLTMTPLYLYNGQAAAQTVPMLNIRSRPGSTNSIQYSTNLFLTNPNWTKLTNLVVPKASFYQFIDYGAASATHRYYRLVEGTNIAPAKINSSTEITSSLNPSVFGRSVTFTATVTAELPAAGTPTGTVQFKTNHVNFGNPVPLTNGSASTPSFALLPMGTITVTAEYGGDDNFNSCSDTLAGGQTVKPVPMVIIPSGEFQMGEPGATTGIAIEHSVSVNAFLMDSNLVSYTLWTDVYQWAINHGYSFGHAGAGKAANHPVQKVDWYDVVKWCNARSEKDGLTPCYYVSTDLSPANVYRAGTNNLGNSHVNWNADGYRLPTEAEWERAARGGTNGLRFPWGDTISKTRANYFGNTYAYAYDEGPNGYHSTYSTGNEPYTSPVGIFKSGRNAYGLYDMAGNVSEWCWDWYGRSYYTTSPANNPQGPNTGTARVVRSGSWRALAASQKCDARDNRAPKTILNTIGFRCVRSLDY